VPGVLLVATTGLFVYSARTALAPKTEVWVVPVVAKPRSHAERPHDEIPGVEPSSEAPALLAQAPGWIEPAPFSTLVPVLAEGVVRDVLVLEGESVVAGQVLARMIDTDALLAVESAEAERSALQASVIKSEAEVRAAEARLAEAEDQLVRSRELAAIGVEPEGQFAQLRFRVSALREDLAAAKSTLLVDQANVRVHDVACAEARLSLSRMEIVAPVAGVVLTRNVEPGTRISMGTRGQSVGPSESMSGAAFRLYDPSRLQVRVDIPLADCAKVSPGIPAEIVTEALPDQVFRGVVSRIVHEANIQRNTVQAKVTIHNPVPTLKPEMLARVRFYSSPASLTESMAGKKPDHATRGPDSEGSGTGLGQADLRLWIPEQVLLDRDGDTARVWVVEHDTRDPSNIAAVRTIRTEPASSSGFVAVNEGLRLGDRVIVNPPTALQPGTRVQVMGEASDEQVRRQGVQP
jgi:multidrug efflux pump subunit AcrA (membrane-fusion protein)